MYSIILVEDDSLQRLILKRMILSLNESIKIHEADSEFSALNIIKKYNINMFLIDINLRESSGLNLAIKIRNIDKYQFSQIIFLTTHMEYITQAFKQTHCYDYILKPYNETEVKDILNKLILYERNHLIQVNNKSDKEREIVITLKNGIYVGIKIGDIFFIEVKGKICEVNTINGMFVANNISLKKILNLINCNYIIQSHRAFAINKKYVCKIEKLNTKLSNVYFNKYHKTALLGYKFKDIVMEEFKKGKILIC